MNKRKPIYKTYPVDNTPRTTQHYRIKRNKAQQSEQEAELNSNLGLEEEELELEEEGLEEELKRRNLNLDLEETPIDIDNFLQLFSERNVEEFIQENNERLIIFPELQEFLSSQQISKEKITNLSNNLGEKLYPGKVIININYIYR